MGISHSWNGTVLTITSDSGTSSADLKGDIGIRGPQGPQGPKGEIDTNLVYTINNPPSAEVVGARPNTWTPTAAEVGAAPAGFGYRYAAGTDEAFMAVIEECLAQMPNDSVRHVSIDMSGRHSVTIHKQVNGYASIEDVTYTIGWDTHYYKRVRSMYNGVWGEWELENPPMQVGVEYRTTERWNSKAVYTQLFDFGALPNTSPKTMDISVSPGSATIQVISVGGQFKEIGGTTSGDLMAYDGIGAHWATCTTSLITFGITTNNNSSAYGAVVRIKYVKD